MKKVIKKNLMVFIVGLMSIGALKAQVNTDIFITLTVKPNEQIQLSFQGATGNTPIRIVSGTEQVDLNVGESWTDIQKYTSGNETMTIYGDLVGFSCNKNSEKITAIDVSKNTKLTRLYCADNSLTTIDVTKHTELIAFQCNGNKMKSIDVSKNTKLTVLSCSDMPLSMLDVTQNTLLEMLFCYRNGLKSLDVTNNTKLTLLDCQTNEFTSLDISKNTELKQLTCSKNKLTSLDISKNTKLEQISCYDNKFSKEAIDDIYCALPDRNGNKEGKIYPVFNTDSENHEIVKSTNSNNAKSRKWKVLYRGIFNKEVPTTGTNLCTSTDLDNLESVSAVVIYPNPVDDILYIQSDEKTHSIKVYNMYGIEVANINGSNQINIAHLPSGVYSVKVIGIKGSSTYRVIKR